MPRYHFRMVAKAFMKGDYVLEADNPDEARRKMLDQTGDVLWGYEELDDDEPIWVRELDEDGKNIAHDIPDLDPDAVKPPPDPLARVDWPMLREQKQALLRSITLREEAESEDAQYLTGILHLIDALQDFAAKAMGVPENQVFMTEDDDE